jgi:hypothetical protein
MGRTRTDALPHHTKIVSGLQITQENSTNYNTDFGYGVKSLNFYTQNSV